MQRTLVFLFFVALLPARSNEADRVLWTGSRLSAGKAEALASELQSKPGDLRRHATLLGYYYARVRQSPDDLNASRERGRHMQWLISHRPDSAYARFEAAWLLPDAASGNAETYATLRDLWFSKVKEFPDSAEVLGNAARFLMIRDRDQSRQLVSRALRLEPRNRDLLTLLGTLDGLAIAGPRDLDRYGLPVRPVAPEPMAADGRTAMKVAMQLDEPHRLCGAGMAIMRYGATMFAAPEAESVWATAASTLTRALRFGNKEKDCLEYAIRLNTWEAMREKGWLAAAIPARTKLVDGNRAQSWQLASVAPVYPGAARARGEQGTVSLMARIGSDGGVVTAEAVYGPPALRQAALEAFRRWKYEPLIMDGKAVEFLTDVQIHFRLSP